MRFAEKLQQLRKERGFSQEELAEEIGVSRQAVSKWESGQSYPEMEKLIAVGRLLGVSIDSLVNEESQAEASYGRREDDFSRIKRAMHYEYKSRKILFGVPLVHINLGFGAYRARGIIAIGNIAVGCLSIGLVTVGGLCLGVLALGAVSLAAAAFGLLFAVGGIAAGLAAVGGAAVGVIAVGGLAVGMFSFGGLAVASHVAIGGYASGHIAIGQVAKGVKTIVVQNGNLGSVSASQVRQLLHEEYPNLWNPLGNWITAFFS